MKALLLFFTLLLFSCAVSKPLVSASGAPPSAPTYYPAPDTGTVAEPVERVRRPQWLSPFGAKPITKTTKPAADSTRKKGVLSFLKGKKSGNKTDNSKCKNCTVVNNYGTGNTTAVVGDKSAPAAVGENAQATDNTKAGQRGGAAAPGAGSSATATAKRGAGPFILYAIIAAIIFSLGVWVGVNFSTKLSWLKRPAQIAGMGVAFALLLLSAPAKAQGPIQLSKPIFHYSYKQARFTQNYLNYRRRQYQRQENRELAELRRKHREQQRYFNKHHRRKG
ncbi:hypothetical protein ACW9KT_15660 [Hymenobacter sp. HD11105]